MAGRSFAIGDIHGDVTALMTLLGRLPYMDGDDTIVFMGDYIDRGPDSAKVVEIVRSWLPGHSLAKIVSLRGNHEDAWLRVASQGWAEYVIPPTNGCFQCYRSFIGGKPPTPDERPTQADFQSMLAANFFPPQVLAWMRTLPYWYEDKHAIYVHAGLPIKDGKFLHPSQVDNQQTLLWVRTEEFFRSYRGKHVVVGHTTTDTLPPELSTYTPSDPKDMWAGECVYAIDTGSGKGGFLTCLELPSMTVYESR